MSREPTPVDPVSPWGTREFGRYDSDGYRNSSRHFVAATASLRGTKIL